MTSNSNLVESREKFLRENPSFAEIEFTDETKPVGKLDEFDLLENEIWLLQCPKDMNITELQNQKLKVPGRSNVNTNEAVSMEFEKGKERHAFAYCNRKGRYVLRLLPVRGTIVVRDRLKAAETVAEERAEECFSSAKRVPMPKGIRVRHPLLGINYEAKTILDKSIEKRLEKADENAAQILNETLKRKSMQQFDVGYEKTHNKETKLGSPIEINSADDDDAVQFVSEEKLKKKKKKNKKSDKDTKKVDEAPPPTKKTNLNEKEFVSKDLQWLQTI